MITEGNVLDFCRLDPECSEMTVGWFSSSGFGLFGYHWVVDTYLGGVPPIPIEPRSPALQVDSLPAEPEGKPENIGMGSLSLLQCSFLTQESNQGLLHCRQILYQLSY